MIEPIRGMSMAMAVRPCGRLVLGCRVASVAAWEALAGECALRFRVEAVQRPDRTVFVAVFEGEDGRTRKRREVGRSAQLLDHAGWRSVFELAVMQGRVDVLVMEWGEGWNPSLPGAAGAPQEAGVRCEAYVATVDSDDETLLDAIHAELEAAAGAVAEGAV